MSPHAAMKPDNPASDVSSRGQSTAKDRAIQAADPQAGESNRIPAVGKPGFLSSSGAPRSPGMLAAFAGGVPRPPVSKSTRVLEQSAIRGIPETFPYPIYT